MKRKRVGFTYHGIHRGKNVDTVVGGGSGCSGSCRAEGWGPGDGWSGGGVVWGGSQGWGGYPWLRQQGAYPALAWSLRPKALSLLRDAVCGGCWHKCVHRKVKTDSGGVTSRLGFWLDNGGRWVAEFLLIVMGILAALAVDDWRQSQRGRDSRRRRASIRKPTSRRFG